MAHQALDIGQDGTREHRYPPRERGITWGNPQGLCNWVILKQLQVVFIGDSAWCCVLITQAP